MVKKNIMHTDETRKMFIMTSLLLLVSLLKWKMCLTKVFLVDINVSGLLSKLK